jgi:hypothetical protein
MVKSRAVCILHHIAFAIPLSLCCKSGLRYILILTECEKDDDFVRKGRIGADNTCYLSIQKAACTHL